MKEKLSNRIRPGSEAAPWVCLEIKALETEIEDAVASRDEWERLWVKASMAVLSLQDKVQELQDDIDVMCEQRSYEE